MTQQLQGYLHFARGRVSAAIRSLEAALVDDPVNPDTLALLANSCLITDHPAAARYVAKLVSIDPLTPLTRCLPGWAAALEGDFAAAVSPYRAMFEMDPGNPMGRLFYVWVLVMNGDHDAAAQLADGYPLGESDSPAAMVARMLVAAAQNRPLPASDGLGPALEAAARTTDIFSRFVADAYALRGEAEAAVQWLSRAVDRGFAHRRFLAQHNPALARIGDHPAFQALLARLESAR